MGAALVDDTATITATTAAATTTTAAGRSVGWFVP